tara:strand:- start:460 stop:891 length:432 start_codon:yes stop_codon:yes gene_type:complete
MDSWRIEVYQDDEDVLAKSVLKSPDGEEWEVLVVTAAPGAITNRYFPDVIESIGSEKRLIVAFDGEQIQQKLQETVAEATLELETVDKDALIVQDHVGTAVSAMFGMYLQRAITAAINHFESSSNNIIAPSEEVQRHEEQTES